ncbi:hypothetical protein H696_01210 [Fonticula alba]|uniref:AMP-dependent synthetase/ligase domain-containing protein n=1 Tax=Fonticula alba TaxID=691883 RepID=A0A058ZEA7_FONAL|nr:hypothetical protein H696_01210 [Fonticula alba]KCV71792.1 hypothetical protein H696_01210 [Fonticula alba]|eukprot:XP_009493370.1 hypothetical protein H696_01210 [Fonticula alba]
MVDFQFDTLSWFLLSAIGVTALALRYRNGLMSPPDLTFSRSSRQALPVEGTRLEGETATYRSSSLPRDAPLIKEMIAPLAHAKTLYDMFLNGHSISRDRPCLGQRRLGDESAPFEWRTYHETLVQMEGLGAGLTKLGVPTGQGEGASIGIFMRNRPEWTIGEFSCYLYSRSLIPIYDSFKCDQLKPIIQGQAMRAIIATSAQIDILLAGREEFPSLTILVCVDPITESQRALSTEKDLRLMTFDEVVQLGKDNPLPHQPPSLDDVAVVCYTSGTTGTPKGAMLTHGNIMAVIAAVFYDFPMTVQPDANDRYLSYLPLAHMLERIIHLLVFSVGAKIGFYRGSVLQLPADMELLDPTYFVSVPLMLNRVYTRIMATVENSGFIKRSIFHLAYQQKLALLDRGIIRRDTIWDRLVFDKIRVRFGKSFKAIVTGAAPIAPEVKKFFRIVCGCPLIEGYGLTETSAVSTLQLIGDYNDAHVGPPLPCAEVKLVDVPEMGYFASDEPNPRGEMYIRGPSVFKGYFNEPELTAKALTADGWFRSGDIAEILPAGNFRLIDRRSNCFKLAQGEFVAPERIENALVGAGLVENVFVYGDTSRSMLVAIVVPDIESLREWAAERGTPAESVTLASMVDNQDLKLAIEKNIRAAAQARGLHRIETPARITLHSEPFSVENGLLTPTFKLRRPAATAAFRSQIDEMYADLARNPPKRPTSTAGSGTQAAAAVPCGASKAD